MKYSIDKQEKYCLIKLHEEKLDSTIAPNLITLHAEGIKNVIIELADVKYTDSSGLSALLVGNRIFHEDGGIFVVAAVTDHVMKLIKISQLDGVLNLLPTAEEAIDAVFMNEIENELKASDNGNN
jgi:anti-sigma B factor antagonist